MSGQEHAARGDPLNQKLPPELVDNMIQFCSDDRDTLSSLSLVCKSWIPLVQSHLFDRICIKPPPETERCDRVLDQAGITRYIQHVVLNLGPQHDFAGNEEDEVRYLLGVVDRLQNSKVLKSLSIWMYHRSNFSTYRQLLETLSSGSFKNILELKIYFGDLREILIEDIVRFICSFPRLQALCGEFFSLSAPLNTDSAVPLRIYTLSTSLKALRIWVPSTSDATNYLDKWFSSQSPRAVSELSISMTPSLKFPSYAASCSSSLRNLTLLLYPESESPGPYAFRRVHANRNIDYDLLSFKVLESLTIVSPSKHHHFVVIRRILETISSSCFQRLRLINVSVYDRVFREQLGTLDGILETEKFKDTIVEIHFLNILCKKLEPCKQEVRSRLRKCFMQGRLEVLAQEMTVTNGRARKNQWWNGPVCL